MLSLARRIVDGRVLHLIKMWLECTVEETDNRGRKTRTGNGQPAGHAGRPAGLTRLDWPAGSQARRMQAMPQDRPCRACFHPWLQCLSCRSGSPTEHGQAQLDIDLGQGHGQRHEGAAQGV